MNLRIVAPVVGDAFDEIIVREASTYAAPDTVVDVVHLERGPASIECAYDDVLAGPEILRLVERSAAEGADAVFVSCVADPAIDAARERVDIPVVGGFTPAILAALAVADRCSIVTVVPEAVTLLRRVARAQGFADRIASIRSIDLPVLEIHDTERMFERLLDEMRAAVAQDGAEALILGCAGMLGVARRLQEALAQTGPFTPVIDPTAAAVMTLEAQLRMGLRPSRRTHPRPPEKQRWA